MKANNSTKKPITKRIIVIFFISILLIFYYAVKKSNKINSNVKNNIYLGYYDKSPIVFIYDSEKTGIVGHENYRFQKVKVYSDTAVIDSSNCAVIYFINPNLV
jgi:hypothetical protein